jgi:ABC-type nitrate/sulfonate/bicarbonate transport system substrate-binding protein
VINRNYKNLLIILFIVCCNLHSLHAFKIGLDWVLNVQHGVLIYAKQKGYLPTDTHFIPFQSSSKALQQLALKTIDCALSYEPNIEAAISNKKFKIKPFFIFCKTPMDCVVSHVPIHELKGKSIGHQSSVGSITELHMKHILKLQGLEFSDITPVFSLYNLKQGLLSRQFDASMNIERTAIPDLKKLNNKLYFYQLSEFGITYNGQVLAVGEDADFPELYEGLKRAKKEILKDPFKAWNVIIKERPDFKSEANRDRWLLYCDLLKTQ